MGSGANCGSARFVCAPTLAVAFTAASMAPAVTSDPSANHRVGGSAERSPKRRTLHPRGLPIGFEARSDAPDASARVWLTVPGYPEMDPADAPGCSDEGGSAPGRMGAPPGNMFTTA